MHIQSSGTTGRRLETQRSESLIAHVAGRQILEAPEPQPEPEPEDPLPTRADRLPPVPLLSASRPPDLVPLATAACDSLRPATTIASAVPSTREAWKIPLACYLQHVQPAPVATPSRAWRSGCRLGGQSRSDDQLPVPSSATPWGTAATPPPLYHGHFVCFACGRLAGLWSCSRILQSPHCISARPCGHSRPVSPATRGRPADGCFSARSKDGMSDLEGESCRRVRVAARVS